MLNGIIPEPLGAVNSICVGQIPRRLFAALSCSESLYNLPQFFKYRSLFCKA